MNKYTEEEVSSISQKLFGWFKIDRSNSMACNFREQLKDIPPQIRKQAAEETIDGCTLLAKASVYGRYELVEFLIEDCRVDIEQKSVDPYGRHTSTYRCTPLWWACKTKNLSVIKLLLRQGADANSLCEHGISPLHRACVVGNSDIIRHLVDNGADVRRTNDVGETSLISYVASRSEEFFPFGAYTDTVKLLLNMGVDPFAKTHSGNDVLEIACLNGLDEVVNTLMDIVVYPELRKAEALELLGVYYAGCNTSKAVQLWKDALQIRINGGYAKRAVEVPFRYGVEEFTTLRALEEIGVNEYPIRIQSLLICDRILGTDNEYTLRHLQDQAAHYYHILFHAFINLWQILLQRQFQKNSILNKNSCDKVIQFLNLTSVTVINDPSLDFGDLLEIFDLLVTKTGEAYQQLKNLTVLKEHQECFDRVLDYLPLVIGALFEKPEDEDDREMLQISVKKLIKCDIRRVLTGETLLHLILKPIATFRPFATDDGVWKINSVRAEHFFPRMGVTKLLLEYGALIDIPDLNDVRPLDILAENPQNDIPLISRTSLKSICANYIYSNGLPYREQLPEMLEDYVQERGPQVVLLSHEE